MNNWHPQKGTLPPSHAVILRVGVTGHRSDNLKNMDHSRLDERLLQVFTDLKKYVDKIPREDFANQASSNKNDSAQSESFFVISPLADGADQIVASAARKCNFVLHSPLPFFKPEELHDAEQLYGPNIKEAEAIFELDGSDETKELAYEAAGRMVLRHSDVLIAVWDGNNARGIGGTGQIVEEAESFRIPIIRINPDEPHGSVALPEKIGKRIA